jgi:hypothetical protein
VEVCVAQKWFDWITRTPDFDGRKKAYLGHYKKSFFRPLKKCGSLAVFHNCPTSRVSVNEYGPVENSAVFDFGPKQVQNTLKKNIVSNLP